MKRLFAHFIVACSALALCSCAGSQPEDNSAARIKANDAYENLEKNSQEDVTSGASRTVAPTAGVAEASQASCPAESGLRGQGVADSYQSALMNAQREIAAQIESTVKSKTETATRSDVDAEGNEIVQSSYAVRSQLLTKLENAQDAKVVFSGEKNGKFSVVACMSYADAALPFQKKFGVLQDSVKLGIALFEKQQHPLQKHEAYKKAKNQFVKMKAVEHILAGLGSADAASAAVDSDFERVKAAYNQFRSSFAMYLDASVADASQGALDPSVARLQKLIFERVSKNFPVRSGECANGLKLTSVISPAVCSEGSLGVSCTVDLSLQGGSCEGEAYFSLSAKVKGTGRYDQAEAMDRIDKNILEGAWFDDWSKELSRWKLD